MKKIVFKNEDNSIGIITPTDDVIYRLNSLIYINDFGQEQYKEVTSEDWIKATEYAVPLLSEKDVPHNLPYWIVEASTIPTDRTFRSAWEIDESFGKPDGFGGESNEFDEELLKAYYGELNDNSKDMLLESQRLIDEQKVLNDSIKTTITQIEELVK